MPNFKYKSLKEQVLNKYIEGFSSSECSNIFGIPASTVRTWIRKTNVSRSKDEASKLAGQKRKKHYYCKLCGKELKRERKSGMCYNCWVKFARGKNHPLYGKKKSKEHIQHMLESRKNIDYWWLKGANNWNYKGKNYCKVCGVEIDRRSTYCYRHAKSGARSHNWKGGITPLRDAIENLLEYKEWRKKVYERDNYTCQLCGAREIKGKKIILHAHHLKSFSVIFQEFLKKYSQFSPVEDKEILFELGITYKPFWDINNGITLCENCHRKIHYKKEVKIC